MTVKTASPDKASEKGGSERSAPQRSTRNTKTVENSMSGFSFLRRMHGNQAIQRLFRSEIIQAKLKIGEPNDAYEQEADRVAEQVMRMPDTAISGQRSAFSRKNESIQMKPG